MAHYQYFIIPKTDLTNQVVNQNNLISLHDESAGLYALDRITLQGMFELKFEMQGTGGRASRQPVDFSVLRRLGDNEAPKELTLEQIECLLRNELSLKPKYLRTAGLIKF